MPKSSIPFAAFVGIDWADKKHDICLSKAALMDRAWIGQADPVIAITRHRA